MHNHHIPTVLTPTSWAHARITAAGGPVPDYGSAAWEQLDDGDPAKLAAACIAAEALRWEETTMADRLARELEATRAAVEDDEVTDAITMGALEAMCRRDYLTAHTRQVIRQVCSRLHGR